MSVLTLPLPERSSAANRPQAFAPLRIGQVSDDLNLAELGLAGASQRWQRIKAALGDCAMGTICPELEPSGLGLCGGIRQSAATRIAGQ